MLNRLIRLNRLVAHQNRNNMRLKNISKNLTAKLTVNRINRLLRLKRFGSVRLIGFGYILPTPNSRRLLRRCDGKIRERTFRRPQGADRGRPRSAGCAPGSGWNCMALVCETGTVETWGSSAPALECFVLSTDVLFDFFQFKP